MKEHYPHVGLHKLCALFGTSRQAYYQHQNRAHQNCMETTLILDKVRQVRLGLPRTGTIKLHKMLKSDLSTHHISIGRDRLRDLLRDNNLLVRPTKRYYVRTTDSSHHYRKWSDLTGTIRLSRSHQLWVSDITYLRTKEEGFLYLSLITDAWSRKIIGHHLSYSLSAKGCVSALNKAIGQLPQGAGSALIHHSDRGIQYCCERYVKALEKQHIGISMTQSGSPYENAKAERVNGILKTELGLRLELQNYGEALRAVNRAIDLYNRIRLHFGCGLRTPEQTHQAGKTSQIQPINPKQLRNQTTCKPKSVLL